MRRSNSSGLLIFIVAVVSLVVGATLASLFGGRSISTGTSSSMEAAVAKVIEEKPDLIVQAFQKGRARQQQADTAKARENVSANRDKLEKDDKSPFVGNPKADVVVVEFFDYNCGYCHRAYADVAKLVAEDKNIKFVFKDFPILGPTSEIAARAALATFIVDPAKYFEVHGALMSAQGQKTEETVLDVVKKAGVNAAKVKEEMKSAKVTEMIQANHDLGRDIGVNGTPAFIIGGNLTPGAMSYTDMKAAVEAARKK